MVVQKMKNEFFLAKPDNFGPKIFLRFQLRKCMFSFTNKSIFVLCIYVYLYILLYIIKRRYHLLATVTDILSDDH